VLRAGLLRVSGAAAALRGASTADLPAVEALLSAAGLPLTGVAEAIDRFVVAEDRDDLVGVAGLEVHGPDGVLRSVAVSPAQQGRGLGARLTERVVASARAAGLRRLYLLTTTAESYFPRHGFRRIERESASSAVRESVEFREACPASAVAMVLELEQGMRYALIGDIHGNLPALEEALADIDERADVGAVYHVGDLVGYAPWPNEVVAALRERAIPGVAGNYDSTTATDYKHCGCKYEDPRQEELSRLSYEWTRAHVTPETKRWLESLPFRIDIRPLGGHTAGPRLILVHGNPVLNTVYWTEDRSDRFCLQMAEQLGAKAGDLVAFGHTHKPWHRTIEGIHFVNTGSVGRPKDGDWRAGYVTVAMDGDAVDVDFVRVDYDLERAASAIRESELPDDFAEYLETGGMPKPAENAADA